MSSKQVSNSNEEKLLQTLLCVVSGVSAERRTPSTRVVVYERQFSGADKYLGYFVVEGSEAKGLDIFKAIKRSTIVDIQDGPFSGPTQAELGEC